MRAYRDSDIDSDHFLTLVKLRFPPQYLHLPKNTAHKENILHYKIRLPSDESIQWLHKQNIQQKLQEIPESRNNVLNAGQLQS